MADVVLVETEGPIATVILNRPDKLNAMNLESWRRVAEVMGEVSERDELRCVLMRGAGDKAFAAGADISEFENERKGAAKGKAYGAVVEAAFTAIAACRHPTVALIKGACIGGGLEIAARCDIRICGESSTFGIPSNRLGLVIAYPELEGLISLVGRGNANEIVLTGAIFGAADARAMGLVNRVVADEAGRGGGLPRRRRHRRARALQQPLAQEGDAPARRSDAAQRGRARRRLRLLRQRGLPRRFRGVPQQDQAGLHRALGPACASPRFTPAQPSPIKGEGQQVRVAP